ncbi:MAG: hypothetical protein ACQEWU_07540 [Bacillota bacterium]
MNEIDFFVDLINDEKQANRILRQFNETVPGHSKRKASLAQKKKYIRTIFKGQTPKIIRKRKNGGGHPFYFHLNSYDDIPNAEDSTAEDFFFDLQEFKDIDATHRFAQALVRFPKETREKLEMMNENLENGKDPFNFGYSFDTFEEWKEFFIRSHKYMGDVEKVTCEIMRDLSNSLDPKSLSMIKKLRKVSKTINLKELKTKIDELDFPNYIVLYSFVLTHPDEDPDILLGLLIESLMKITKEYSTVISKSSDESDMKAKLAEKYQEELKEKEQKISELNNKLSDKRKDYHNAIKDKKALDLQNRDKEIKINELQKKLADSLKVYDKKFKEIKRDFERKEENLQSELRDKEKNVQDLTLYLTDERVYSFMVIYTHHMNLLELIYPEIQSVHYSKWQEVKDELKTENITNVFIQRNGMSTSRFYRIKKEVKQLGYKPITFNANSPKEVIDMIGYQKLKERGNTHDGR